MSSPGEHPDSLPIAPAEMDSAQDKILRELDLLNERIEAVIGQYLLPRTDELDSHAVEPHDGAPTPEESAESPQRFEEPRSESMPTRKAA